MISEFLQERVDSRDFPSAVYLIAEKGKIVIHEAIGDAVVLPERIPARIDTIYDLASLTKVLVTGLLLAHLIEQRRIELHAQLREVLPGVELGRLGTKTILEAATHTTGLPGWLPFYLLVGKREDILGEIALIPLRERNVVYGDPNFWVLTFIIERIFDEPITQTARRIIFEPLCLKETLYRRDESDRQNVAASENGTVFERQLCTDLGYEYVLNRVTNVYGFRDTPIWGEVHDQNAWFFGNVCGHAGLFSSAADVLSMAKQFLPAHTAIIEPETCSIFARNYTSDLNQHRSFAFELASTPASTAGSLMSPQAFGHLGFTGTSLWIDPVKDRIFILLTNRTHDHALPLANLNTVRRRFHDLAVRYLDGNS